MQDTPNAIDLLQSVAAFLRNAAIPKLSGREAFDARVAANVLDIVERELRRAPEANAAEHERLRRLLGADGALEALNLQLCEAIAAGHIGLYTPGLTEHLWTVTLNKLAIDQPAYSSYRAALQAMEQ